LDKWELLLSPEWLRLGHQALFLPKVPRVSPEEELGMEGVLIQVCCIMCEIEGGEGGEDAEVMGE
jgi:hypothetical protein